MDTPVPSNLDLFNNDNKFNDKKFYCINCGKNGHISKKCLCPIISIGIICIKINIDDLDMNSIINFSKRIQNNFIFSMDEINKLKIIKQKLDLLTFENIDDHIEYLMIRRRNSLNYVEFIRGKYDIYNLDYLIKCFNFITIEERNMIKNNNFNTLWNDLWGDKANNMDTEYIDSKDKFSLLKNGFFLKKNEVNLYISLDKILQETVYNYYEPEWGFPKGRRNSKEKNIECAKREFEEETLINTDNINILNLSPLEETYIASNNLKYKHIYYISQIKNNNIDLKLDLDNSEQKIEIGDIKWSSFKDSISLIREYNIEKKNTLLSLHYNIKYIIDNSKLLINNLLLKKNNKTNKVI